MAWRIHHVNLPSPNLDASVDFYTDVFGMENVRPPYEDSYQYRRPVGWFQSADGPQVHLSGPSPNFAQIHDIHVNPTLHGHLALEVDDIEAVRARLEARGIYCSPPRNFLIRGYLQMYTVDPCGNTLEILQPIQR